MNFRFSTIASGSSGNCVYVGTQQVNLLVDVGLSGKKVEAGLEDIGVDPKEIDGIFITHEHSDHIKGIGVMSRRHDIPIFANAGTWKALEEMGKIIGKIHPDHKQVIESDRDFCIKDLIIHPYSIPHDAAAPVGYAFYHGNKKISMATDLGHVSENVRKNLRDSNLLLLEANHDLEMLKFGSYPYYLKRRVMGDYGHLCNDVAGELLVDIYHEKLQTVILGHLSAENNFPELAYQTVENVLKKMKQDVLETLELLVASRKEGSKVYVV